MLVAEPLTGETPVHARDERNVRVEVSKGRSIHDGSPVRGEFVQVWLVKVLGPVLEHGEPTRLGEMSLLDSRIALASLARLTPQDLSILMPIQREE